MMNNKNRKNVRYEEIPVEKIVKNPKLKDPDSELLDFFAEMFDVNLNSGYSEFVFKNGMSYLDSLCSIRFDICPATCHPL